jgi:hypothetical protein
MNKKERFNWLLDGDVSIQYQVYRDLLDSDREDLRTRIGKEGWGARFLSHRRKEGHWGQKFYQPKWTSSHYTLLDLRNLCIDPLLPQIRESIGMIIAKEKGPDGGIRPIGSVQKSDVCINGMFLNYASYFRIDEHDLQSVIDFILTQQLDDGGFNCMYNRSGARHSSLHSTLSVVEGTVEYEMNGYRYKLEELKRVREEAEEFMLIHRLFLSDRTGQIIHKDFLRLAYPGRWRYDILRALDYFQYAKHKYDERFEPAFEVLMKKRRKDNRWPLQAKHPGQVHFEMEKPGKPSRWNTLRALRVLNYFKRKIDWN